VAVVEERFVVVEIDLGGTARHEQVDDPFGFWWEMSASENPVIGRAGFCRQHFGESETAEAQAEAVEEMAPIDWVHRLTTEKS
jgi:hypothetical protein